MQAHLIASAVVYATAAIAVLSFIVWTHHMFTTGMPVEGQLFFMYATMLIAVPTGVKIFNRLATMWRGSLTFETPMLFAIGFIYADYPMQFADMNMIVSIGAFGFGLSQLLLLYDVLRCVRGKGAKAGDNCFNAREGLEWTVPSPPPFHTFATPPVVPPLADEAGA
jgi:heme/copper-type cytochrome/quinol oxidase subunit 1